MAILLEDQLPGIKQAGLNTNKAAAFGGSVTFTGSKSGGTKSVVSTAATLTASQSTTLCVFSTAAGQLYTLPAPVVGLSFDFFVQTTATSLSHKVITNAGTVFLVGAISYGILDTTPGANPGPKFTAADGSTIVSIAMNGSTTGGVAGTYFTCTCISATQWLISGLVIASGTISTPFSTS
jgi:hypothetical protein